MVFSKILAAIPGIKAVTDICFNVVDEIRSNPKLKLEALRKVDAESQERHNEAMAQLKQMQQEHDEDFKKRETAANQRIQDQREENEKIVRELTRKSREQDEKFDEDVRKINEKHSKKISEMRSESKADRDKAEREHRMKVEMLETEHKKEKMETETKLAKAKKEGLEKISVAEKEKDDIAEERNKELVEYIAISKQVEEAHQKNVQEIRKRNNALRQENMKLKREQLAVENQKKLDESHKLYLGVLSTLTIENSRNVIQKFEAITNHIIPVRTSLDQIKQECLPECGDEPNILPGYLDEDFRSIKAAINDFEYSKRMFTQYLINTNLTDRRLFDACSKLIVDMSNTMSQEELTAICVRLPRAIDSQNTETIKKFGETTKKMRDKFLTLEKSLTKELGNLQRNHLPSASNPVTNSIEK